MSDEPWDLPEDYEECEECGQRGFDHEAWSDSAEGKLDPPEARPVTILDVAKFMGAKEPFTLGTFEDLELPFFGGCQVCHATIAAYNACPSRNGYLRCASGCIFSSTMQIGSYGYETVEEAYEAMFPEKIRTPDCCAKSLETRAVRVLKYNEEDYCACNESVTFCRMDLQLPDGNILTIPVQNCPFCHARLGGQTCVGPQGQVDNRNKDGECRRCGLSHSGPCE